METIVKKISDLEKKSFVQRKYADNMHLKYALIKGGNYLSNYIYNVSSIEIKDGNYIDNYVYKVTQKETREYLKELLSEGGITVQNFTYQALIKKYPELISEIALEPDIAQNLELQQELIEIALSANAKVYNNLNDELKNTYRKVYLKESPHGIKKMVLAQDKLTEIVNEIPAVMEYLDSSKITKEMLYEYLRKCVKNEYYPSYTYYWTNIADELKDKTYYQARAMMNPFYISQCPQEYRCKSLYDYALTNIDSKRLSGAAPLTLLEEMPEEYITEEIALKFCCMHFMAILKIPKKYQTEEFYEKLYDMEKYHFISDMDYSTISEELLIKCLEKQRYFWFYDEKKLKSKWTDKLVLAYAKASNLFYSHVPKKYQSKEACIVNLIEYGSIKEFPEKYMTDDVLEAYMEKSSASHYLPNIPDKYKTDEFYEKYSKCLRIEYKYIPEALRTKELTMAYILGKKTVPFECIKKEIIDNEIIKSLYNSCEHYHFNQGNQNAHICDMMFDVMMETGIENVKKNMYMFSHLTKEKISILLEHYDASSILSSILYNYRTEEVCDTLFDADPRCIIYIPETMRDKYRNRVITPVEKTLEDMCNKKIITPIDDVMIDTFEQLSLFDMLGIA